MTNDNVLKCFMVGYKAKSKSNNLRTTGDTLINYDTVIAYKKEGLIFINGRRYSVTTSKIVGQLKSVLNDYQIEYEIYN